MIFTALGTAVRGAVVAVRVHSSFPGCCAVGHRMNLSAAALTRGRTKKQEVNRRKTMATLKKNPYPEQHDTHERQQGDGNTTATGEKHDLLKAKTIPANRRWDDSATTPSDNRQGKE